MKTSCQQSMTRIISKVTNKRSSSAFAIRQINQIFEKLEDRLIMVIKGNNGKAPARKRQPVAASSNCKSKRSVAVPKNPVFRDNGKAANELDGNIVCDESR